MTSIALLMSGGLDSSVLAVELTKQGSQVTPIYVQHGLSWEGVEHRYLSLFLDALSHKLIKPPVTLQIPVADIYQQHWSVSGEGIPDDTTEDAAVYLPGRNLMLLAIAGTWCKLNNIGDLALATLNGNPFSDNTEKFYQHITESINLALDSQLTITQPFRQLHKADVIQLGKNLPLNLTFSCIQPANNIHCGVCNKCAERKKAFIDSGISDTTDYQE